MPLRGQTAVTRVLLPVIILLLHLLLLHGTVLETRSGLVLADPRKLLADLGLPQGEPQLMQAESRRVGVEARHLHPVARLLHARAWLQVPKPGLLEYRNRLPEPSSRLLVPIRRQL